MNTDNAFLILNKPIQTVEWNFWLAGASSMNANAAETVILKSQADHVLA